MASTNNNIEISEKSKIEELKKEIKAREADYLNMDSEKARKEDSKAAYRRYMQQADGVSPVLTVIAAVFLVVLVAVLGYAILERINGTIVAATQTVIVIVCALCMLGITAIIVSDIIKRDAEAKMRLSSHIHRYNMQVRVCKAELEELKAKLAELEKNTR